MSIFDDGSSYYNCEGGLVWGYCIYGGEYGDIYNEWWYEDDGATYVTYNCNGNECNTCVYDTSDWSSDSECEEPDYFEKCEDHEEETYYECSTAEYYYYHYYGEDYYYETYSDHENG